MSDNFFPPLGVKEDSKFFKIQREDKAVLSETHGYVYSRPRHARPARRIITTGLSQLTQGQFEQVDQFISKYGRFQRFKYMLQTTGEVLTVRFEGIPEGKYAGVGGVHIWEFTDIKLVEV